jgi:hypothetical protein
MTISRQPCSTEGRLPEAFGWRSGVRLPRAGSQPALGRPGAPPGGHYGLPAESRLIRTAQAVLESAARERKEAAVERREARRPASSAGDLGRTRDRPYREAGHGWGASPPAPVGALPPSCGGTRDRRPPRRKQQGAAERWLLNFPLQGGGRSRSDQVGVMPHDLRKAPPPGSLCGPTSPASGGG